MMADKINEIIYDRVENAPMSRPRMKQKAQNAKSKEEESFMNELKERTGL